MPPLASVLGVVDEGASHMDEVCYSCEKSAEFRKAFEALWVFHISGDTCEACQHLGTHLRIDVRVNEVVSL